MGAFNIEVLYEAAAIAARNRDWFLRETERYPLHPTVVKTLSQATPRDWQRLMLQWPHVSADGTRLAYTRSEDKGIADVQTVTSVGKYLREHFSELKDHEIRNLSAVADGEGYKIVRTMDEMLEGVQKGPHSCMSSSLDDFSSDCHPYEVYDPSLGWAMALYVNPEGGIDGRALILEAEGRKVFVRTYKRCPEGGYSHSHDGLHGWLEALGYEKWNSWPCGAKLRLIPHDGGFVAPYLDGSDQHVRREHDALYIDEDGDVCCDNTSGLVEVTMYECADCGEESSNPDHFDHVGRWGDRRVGSHHSVCNCADSYTSAIGINGQEYLVNSDHVTEVNGTYYHDDYLSENGIVSDVDGDYQRADDCVYIDSENEYYRLDDDRITRAADTGRWEVCDRCWRCFEGGDWYRHDEPIDLLCPKRGAIPIHLDNVDSFFRDNPGNLALLPQWEDADEELIDLFVEQFPEAALVRYPDNVKSPEPA